MLGAVGVVGGDGGLVPGPGRAAYGVGSRDGVVRSPNLAVRALRYANHLRASHLPAGRHRKTESRKFIYLELLNCDNLHLN